MAGCDAIRAHGGRNEPIGDRLNLVRVRRLTLVLLLVVAGLAAFHPATATARPYSPATDPIAVARPGGPFATESGQHGIENRDPAPRTVDRRAARGVDSTAPRIHRPDQSLSAHRTRLRRPVHAVPPSRAAGGNSSRAPPRAA
jgi:hypothetical protein